MKISKEILASKGYFASQRLVTVVNATLNIPAQSGARAILVEGPPGAGKSQLAQALADIMDAELIVYQLHSWTDADELFVGVDVASAVAGDAKNVRQSGVLSLASSISQTKQVVLLLDEVDKAQERAENLLLDWLQSGRCPVQPGRHVVADFSNLLVILTSNGEREIGAPLRRRVSELALGRPDQRTLEAILASNCPKVHGGLRRACAKLLVSAWSGRQSGAYDPAPSELIRFLHGLDVVESAEEVRDLWRSTVKCVLSDQYAAGIWGDVSRQRKIALVQVGQEAA